MGYLTVILEMHEDSERMTSRLRLIENHQAFGIPINCFSLANLQYLLLAFLASMRGNDSEEFNRTLVTALSRGTNIQFEGESLQQSALPVRMEGLRISLRKDITLPALISTLQCFSSLVCSVLHRQQI